MDKIKILLLEDDEFDIYLIKKTLEKAGLEVDLTNVSTEAGFSEALFSNAYDAILSDNSLPQFNATKALEIIKAKKINLPFILVTGTVSEEFAVQIMRDGAWDYILKDRLQRLPNALLNAIDKHQLETEYQKNLRDIIESEALMKEAERLAHFGSWEVDLVTGRHYWSDENFRMLGYRVGDVSPSFDNFISRIHHEDQYYVQNTIDDALKDQKNQKYYCRVNHKKGVLPRHVEGEIFITKNEYGKLIRINGFTRDISERRNAEIQIHESEKKYQHLFENNPLPAWVIDNDTFTFLDVNRAAIDHYGYSYREFLSMTAIEIRPDDEKDRFFNLDRSRKQSGREGLWKHKKKDGTIIHVEVNTVEITFEGKQCKLVIVNDITEKIKAENELKHTTLRLNQAQEIAHIGSWEHDLSTDKLIWSDEMYEIYGISPENDIQSFDAFVKFIHPEDLDYVLSEITKAHTTLSGSSYYHRIIRKDGMIRHVYVQFEYEVNKKGKAIARYGVVHDVTDTKEAEQALIQSEANLRLIMDMLPQTISARNFDGEFLFVNKSFANMYNLIPEKMIGTSLKEIVQPPNDINEFTKRDQGVILSGETRTIPEMEFTDAAGNERIFQVTKVPFIPAGADEKVVLGIGTDITEQKMVESERAKMIADIVQRNKDLEQFSYIVSHNLRAPVANLLGISDLFKKGNLTEAERDFLMDGLTESVKKLDDVIIDLNHITQVKHSMNESREQVKFSNILDNVMVSISHLVNNKAVNISTDFSELDTCFTVNNYMHSIFYNLITNSIKYRKNDTPLTCEIKSRKNEDNIELIFKDNGIGIDLKRYGSQVFELYRRFHIGLAEGKGMGLFMVKTHVESMGGKISVVSEVDKGAEFRIRFPVQLTNE